MSDLGQSVTEGFVVRALVLAWAAITNTTGWAASTTEFISHGSKGRKIQDQDPAQSGSGEGSLPSLQMAAFLKCAHAFPWFMHVERERERDISLVSLLIRSLIQ